MARNHQEMLVVREKNYEDDVKLTTIEDFSCESYAFEKYHNLLIEKNIGSTGMQNVFTIKSLQINSVVYKSGLLVLCESRLYEIEYVLINSSDYWLLCSDSYNVHHTDSFCNSFVLEKLEGTVRAINLIELNHEKTYEKLYFENEIHVKVENMHLYSQNM